MKKTATVETEDEIPHIDETTVGSLSEQVHMTLHVCTPMLTWSRNARIMLQS